MQNCGHPPVRVCRGPVAGSSLHDPQCMYWLVMLSSGKRHARRTLMGPPGVPHRLRRLRLQDEVVDVDPARVCFQEADFDAVRAGLQVEIDECLGPLLPGLRDR
jgi:hypothetical protein